MIGITAIVFSMVIATQFASTRTGYSYSIVHPSNADIRFIGSDNSSDGVMVLRVDGDNSSGSKTGVLWAGVFAPKIYSVFPVCCYG